MDRRKGFGLIELLITVLVIGILAAIALPAYADYVRRAKIHDAFNNLLVLNAMMQRYHLEANNYGPSACGVAMPPDTKYFHFICDINNSQQGFLLTAKGQGDLLNYNFTVDDAGRRVTIDFPGVSGLPYSCWMDRPGACVVK